MSSPRNRVLVVRAWRDGGQQVIRVLAGEGHAKPVREWVCRDIAEACQRISDVLAELEGRPNLPPETNH